MYIYIYLYLNIHYICIHSSESIVCFLPFLEPNKNIPLTGFWEKTRFQGRQLTLVEPCDSQEAKEKEKAKRRAKQPLRPKSCCLTETTRSKTTSGASCLAYRDEPVMIIAVWMIIFPNKWYINDDKHVVFNPHQGEGWTPTKVRVGSTNKSPGLVTENARYFLPLYALDELLQVHCTGITFPSKILLLKKKKSDPKPFFSCHYNPED